MKKISTANKIMFSYMLVVLVTVLLIAATLLPSQLDEMDTHLETSISQTVAILASDSSIQESVLTGAFSNALLNRLDQIVKETSDLDYIVIANKDSRRLYHPDHTLIGKSFIGGDEVEILNGAAPYITQRQGNTDAQKRAFHSINDSEGKIIGFIMISASMSTINEARHALLTHLLIILMVALFIGIVFSIFLSRSIRKVLLGFEPSIFAKMFQQRDRILDTMEDSIVAIDQNGNYQYRNPAAERFFSAQINPLETSLGEHIRNCISEKCSLTGLLIEHGDDTFLVNLLPLIKRNRCDAVIITARNKSELTQMAEQLTGMNHIIDAMRANTHEYMNKLHVISGLLQIGETKQALSFITENTSESEMGHRAVINQIQNKTLAALIIGKQNRAKELDIQFILQKESFLGTHNDYLSVKELVTVIGNLVENAFEALKNQSHLRQVELMIRSDVNGLTVTVDDTGCGMTTEQINKIYVGQYTSKGTGHGYGLRLIQEIVRNHEGFFTIDSEPGEGTSMSIVINKKREKKYKEKKND